jgi:MFS family permease
VRLFMTPPKNAASSDALVHRTPFYYGWVVLVVATLGMAATLPGQTAGVSLFIDAFIADLGLSRSAVSWFYTVATVLGALALPLVGRLIDRYGPRRVALVVIVCFAASCAGMRWVHGGIGVFVGFVGLRGFGQGAFALINNHAVNLWFERRRGLAVGILGLGMSGATAFFPPLIDEGIQVYGWESTYLVMGGLLAVVMLPLAVLYRDAPETYGLTADEPEADAGDGSSEEADGTVWGLAPETAYRTGTFWLFTAAGVCTAGLGTGLLFHHFSILAETGVGRDLAAQFFIPLGVVTAVFNVSTGWLVDRAPPRLLLAGQLGLFGGMIAGLPAVDTTLTVWLYGSVFGVSQGMQQALIGSAYAYYFGRRHHGTIRGFANTIFIGGTAIGPAVLALGPDLMSGFTPILWMLVPIPGLLALVSLGAWATDWDATVLRRPR